jgi:hypothetical protein
MNGSTIKMPSSYADAARESHQSISFSAGLQKERLPGSLGIFQKLFLSF